MANPDEACRKPYAASFRPAALSPKWPATGRTSPDFRERRFTKLIGITGRKGCSRQESAPGPAPPSLRVARRPPTICMRHYLAVHIRVGLPMRFCELAVFDARLYIRVRRVDQPA
jgi:hypothetical protein